MIGGMPTLARLIHRVRTVFSRLFGSNPPIQRRLGAKALCGMPIIAFDPRRVTHAVRADLTKNIREIDELKGLPFNQLYDEALQSILKGGDVGGLNKAIQSLAPDLPKRRAGEIASFIHRRAKVLINRDRQLAIGARYALWQKGGAPCGSRWPEDKSVDELHRTLDGKQYKIAKGMRINGQWTYPGYQEGCKCISRSVIPGFV